MRPVPSNWGYVLAAYGIAAVVLLAYWRYLAGRARALGRAGKNRRAA